MATLAAHPFPARASRRAIHLGAAGVAWSLGAVAQAGLATGLLLLALAPVERWPADLARQGAATYALYAGAFAAFGTVGAFVAGRRPQNPVGWLLLGTGLAAGVSTLANGCLVAAPVDGRLPGASALPWLALWGRTAVLPGIAAAVLLFPDGRLPSRRWRPVAGLVVVSAAVDLAAAAVAPQRLLTTPFLVGADPSQPADAGPGGRLLLGAPLLEVTVAAAAALAAVWRFRRARGRERAQLKWLTWPVALGALGFAGHGYVALAVAAPLEQPAAVALLVTGLAVAGLPAAVGLAVLRSHLYGIDVLLNRTLVYVPLTAILAGLYAASITLFQRLFLALTGAQSDAALVLTTLVLSAAFTPIKNRLQAAVDARFGAAADPVRRLALLGDQLRSDVSVVDPHRLAHRLLDEAVPAFRTQSGAVYLIQPGRPELVYDVGGWPAGGAALSVPLRRGDEQLGVLHLGPRPPGHDYTPRDRRALRELAGLVAEAIASAAPAPADRGPISRP